MNKPAVIGICLVVAAWGGMGLTMYAQHRNVEGKVSQAIKLIEDREFEKAKAIVEADQEVAQAVYEKGYDKIMKVGLTTMKWEEEYLTSKPLPPAGTDICQYSDLAYYDLAKQLPETDEEYFRRTQMSEEKKYPKNGFMNEKNERKEISHAQLYSWFQEKLHIDLNKTSLLVLNQNKVPRGSEKILVYDMAAEAWMPNPKSAPLRDNLRCARGELLGWYTNHDLETKAKIEEGFQGQPFTIPMSPAEARKCTPTFLVKMRPTGGLATNHRSDYVQEFKVISSGVTVSLPIKLEKVVILCVEDKKVIQTLNYQ